MQVGDTTEALGKLGAPVRATLTGPLIGITGSVGKTSVKGSHRRRPAVLAAGGRQPRSFNTELGVPLTLLNAPADSQVVVVEMGLRGRGHILDLCHIARPSMALITTVALAHTETFGSIDEVATEKSTLIRELPPSGTAASTPTTRVWRWPSRPARRC